MSDTADKIVSLIESLLPSNDPRPYSHRIGPAGTGSGQYLTGATDTEAELARIRFDAARSQTAPLAVAMRPAIVEKLS